jgi:hypothetical protein
MGFTHFNPNFFQSAKKIPPLSLIHKLKDIVSLHSDCEAGIVVGSFAGCAYNAALC